MSNDLTFITNQGDDNLKKRFASLIRDTQFFDVLVGYFYASGFYAIYPELENTEKIRILIGISTNKGTYDLLEQARSHKNITDQLDQNVQEEMEESENTLLVEKGVRKFLQWLQSGKLEIKAYPEEKIHSKLYIMTFNEEDRDLGRVITGSSNFTQSGLVDNLEFNVELKDRSDYEFAKEKFEELWQKSTDVSEQYIETLAKNTWLREDITPYELYLKFLYEYFKEEINEDGEIDHSDRPKNFKQLKYQDHAVINAKRIVEEYGGVFLSDVVGLGKTFMGTMLCQELGIRVLVLAPPHLIDENNTGSWSNAFSEFGFRNRDYKCMSIGVLDKIIEKEIHHDFDAILIDEAHKFRTETTETYAKLAQICRGKKVILVTATPYNNSPSDLLAQIKLFQRVKKSNIPNLPDIEGFFKALERNLKGLDRKKDKEEFIRVTKENSSIIRERLLKYLMVRRTRNEIEKYYAEDLKQQNLSFPKVADPQPVFYEFNEVENQVFFDTLEILTKKFKYARYTPLLYRKDVSSLEKQQQVNMMKFMKMLLVKRLESSFFAFRQSLDRFIHSYTRFIAQYEEGNVFFSKKHQQKIFDLLHAGDLASVEALIDSGKAEKFASSEFNEQFIADLRSDLAIMEKVKKMWTQVERDPKLIAFKEKLAKEKSLKEGKSIIFTESRETAEYLTENLKDTFGDKILNFSGLSHADDREVVLQNFDANSKKKKNDYSLLITTDVLSEGVNLHQANVVINYDIPWNPTRIMQRVGRINRVDTSFKNIYSYTFFPTEQSNDQIKLKELAQAKIQAFITLLGADAKLLTEEEEGVEGHGLFNQILSKATITGEDESDAPSELSYLQEIRQVRDTDPVLFEKIKRLPKKARSARQSGIQTDSLLTYFRKGKLQKFFLVNDGKFEKSTELDFSAAAEKLKVKKSEKGLGVNESFYVMLEKNLAMLQNVTELEDDQFTSKRGSRDNAARLVTILGAKQIRNYAGFTDTDEEYLEAVLAELNSGSIPKKVTQKLYAKIESTPTIITNPIKLIGLLKTTLPSDFLQPTVKEQESGHKAKKEIILSVFYKSV